MSKKFIEIDGKKHFIHDEKDAEPETPETPETPEAPAAAPDEDPAAGGEADAEKEGEAAGKAFAAAFKKEMGLDKKSDVNNRVNRLIDQPENSKLKSMLHGKDPMQEKDKLTKEEKIVAFYHALVTKNEAVVKALSEGVAADGGNLFPTEFVSELIRPLSEVPRARALVRVVPMRRNTLTVPTQATRPKVYWTAENAAKTTTTATFGQVVLTARKAAAILYSSDELIEDSTEIDVVRLIIDQFAEAIGSEEDRVILRGNGTTEPTGIVTARAAGTIAATANTGNMDFDDIIDLIYGLKAKYRAGASFLVHPNNVKELRKVKDGNSRYIWQDAVAPGQPSTIYGYPVHEFYDLPETEILFGNWKLTYWLGDRKQMTVKISQDTTQAFTQDETAIRVVFRIGGNVVLGEAAHALTSIP